MKHLFFLFLFLSISFFGHGQGLFKPTLRVSLLGAPEKDLEGVEKVAVLDFENISSNISKEAGADLGSKTADYLVSALIKEYRGKGSKCYISGGRTNIYSIVERSQIDKILNEQELGVSGAIDETQAVQVGKLLGIDAVILGNVSYSSKDERDKSSYTDKKGVKHTTYKLTRTTSAEVRMKIISVETGEVMGQKNSRASRSDKASGKQPPSSSSVASAYKLAELACETLSNRMANYFTPYYYTNTFTFENVKNKELKERAKDAKEFIKLGEIDKAYQMYNAIYQVDQYNPELLFNLGVLNEVVGNYEDAKKLYSTAVNMAPDNKVYVGGVNRSKANIKLIERLGTMGIEIEPYTFPEADASANLLAEKVKVKGSKSKRIPVYSNESKGGDIIAKIPGGMEFNVVKRSDDKEWILVKLPSGEEGYFYYKDVIEGK